MILSYHPIIVGDENRLCAGREPDQEDRSAMERANIVILPQGCKESLYRMATENSTKVFPDYKARFLYPGKVGQARLFEEAGVPHPRTYAYEDLESFTEKHRNNPSIPLTFPCVFKLNWGGEGSSVYLLHSMDDFHFALSKAKACERGGQTGFLFQEFIETKTRSLRVVAIHESFTSYWRVGAERGGFGTSLSHGARVDQKSDPELIQKGEDAVKDLCRKTGINLAGFDLIFDETKADPEPLFLEINYFFGRRGLGGSEQYYILLHEGIKEWLSQQGAPTVV